MHHSLADYVNSIWDDAHDCEVFAKILAENDDSGRHGIVVPIALYPYFPYLHIDDPKRNATAYFSAYDVEARAERKLAWKYYQRYPERRITRFSRTVNDRTRGRRIAIFVRDIRPDGSVRYAVDASVETIDERFPQLLRLLFADSASGAGAYVERPVDQGKFVVDDALDELLREFDKIKAMGFVRSMRSGTTGVGYTFETLLGIEENNDQTADFRGIEIKCSMVRDSQSSSGVTNLFQAGPSWTTTESALERLRRLGSIGTDGRLACHSRVTTNPNNRGLQLKVDVSFNGVEIALNDQILGAWTAERLETRLLEKHSRAVFVKAVRRRVDGEDQYHYQELIYCERPDIRRFLKLVQERRINFEFMMHAEGSRVRNHGYPWRLVDQRELAQLFALQIQLRQ